MDDNVCLDINVFLKLYFNEEDSSTAANYFTYLIEKNASIILPAYAKIEFLSVARKKEVMKQVARDHVDTAVELFIKNPAQFIQENDALLAQAYEIAKQIHSSVIYDTLYLALAQILKTPYVTADMKFIKKAKTVYPHSYSLKEALDMTRKRH